MFDAIGEGHKILHEGPKKEQEVDLDALERLAKAATTLPWEVDDCHNVRIAPKGRPIVATIHDDEDYLPRMTDAAYIVAACNAVPELIAENRALREKVRKLKTKLEFTSYRHDEALKLYSEYHDANVGLRNEVYRLETALKSVLCDLIELNPAYCGPCHGCKDGKKETPLLCRAAMLEAYKEEAKESGE